LRLFTAIELPADIKARLADLVERLKLHWIPTEKLHITTKFIGEWPEERLDELKRALATIKSPGPVEIVIRGLGWLPNARNARVLYAGVEPSEALTTLALATERAVGVPSENRAYRPHVTLARTRKAVPLAEIEHSDVGSFKAVSFALYLSASGKYTKLQEFSLK
jgi:RNA 2',3'-cyclic 3'-phosphodiesterase